MSDTLQEMARNLLHYSPPLEYPLARRMVRNAYRRIMERRRWASLYSHNQFLIPAAYSAGTVSVTNGSPGVVGTGTAWTSALVGQQFYFGSGAPIYTVISVGSSTILTLDLPFGGATGSGLNYQIFQAYVTPQSDCLTITQCTDPVNGWDLELHHTQDELNYIDPQRTTQGLGRQWLVDLRLATSQGPPMYELWPYVFSQAVFPYEYLKRMADLLLEGDQPAPFIRGDVILEAALVDLCLWPGKAPLELPANRNPLYGSGLHQAHEDRFRDMMTDVERNDDEIYERDVLYNKNLQPSPLLTSADWLRSH